MLQCIATTSLPTRTAPASKSRIYDNESTITNTHCHSVDNMQLQNAVDTHIRLHSRHSTHHNSAVRQHNNRPTNIYYIQPRHNICRPPKNRMSLSHTDRHYISKLYRHSVCYHTTTTTTRKTTSEIHLPDTVFDTVFVFRFKVQKGIESSLLSIPFLHSLSQKKTLHYYITTLHF